MTAKLQIFSNCEKLIETLPQLLIDPKNNETVLECDYDHWYDGCGYGLIARHQSVSKEPEKHYEVPYAFRSQQQSQAKTLVRW